MKFVRRAFSIRTDRTIGCVRTGLPFTIGFGDTNVPDSAGARVNAKVHKIPSSFSDPIDDRASASFRREGDLTVRVGIKVGTTSDAERIVVPAAGNPNVRNRKRVLIHYLHGPLLREQFWKR